MSGHTQYTQDNYSTLAAHARRGLINPRRACAAIVTVVVLCVCMYVCMCATHTCRLTHWNHKREIPTDSAQYRDRLKFLPIFLNMFRSKVMA